MEEQKGTVLQPLEQGLSDEQVLELYRSGALYARFSAEREVDEMMHKAIHRVMRCKGYLAKGKTGEEVANHFRLLFGGEGRGEAMRCMRSKDLRPMFICREVGKMMVGGIFYAYTRQLAMSLGYTKLNCETLMRYIRRGKSGK